MGTPGVPWRAGRERRRRGRHRSLHVRVADRLVRARRGAVYGADDVMPCVIDVARGVAEGGRGADRAHGYLSASRARRRALRRNSRVDLARLREMGAVIDPTTLKTAWLQHSHAAEREIDRAAVAGVEVGLAFVNADRKIGWFDQAGYTAHRATLGGALPRMVQGS